MIPQLLNLIGKVPSYVSHISHLSRCGCLRRALLVLGEGEEKAKALIAGEVFDEPVSSIAATRVRPFRPHANWVDKTHQLLLAWTETGDFNLTRRFVFLDGSTTACSPPMDPMAIPRFVAYQTQLREGSTAGDWLTEREGGDSVTAPPQEGTTQEKSEGGIRNWRTDPWLEAFGGVWGTERKRMQ